MFSSEDFHLDLGERLTFPSPPKDEAVCQYLHQMFKVNCFGSLFDF